MYFLYLDECGGTGRGNDTRKYLSLTGIIIHDTKIRQLDGKIHSIKKDYFNDYKVELKSNEIRRNEGLVKIHDEEKRKEFLHELIDLVANIKYEYHVISIVIDIEKFKTKKYKHDPIDYAYSKILKIYNKFLVTNKNNGIVVMDSVSGKLGIQERNGDSDSRMRWLHRLYQYGIRDKQQRLKKVVAGLFTVDSRYDNLLQLADLCCYPFYARYENNHLEDRVFKALIKYRVYKGISGKIIEGFKLLPKGKSV